jgi:hypothetical protein
MFHHDCVLAAFQMAARGPRKTMLAQLEGGGGLPQRPNQCQHRVLSGVRIQHIQLSDPMFGYLFLCSGLSVEGAPPTECRAAPVLHLSMAGEFCVVVSRGALTSDTRNKRHAAYLIECID